MDTKTINMLVEQRLTAIDQIQDNLIEGWSPFVGAVNQYTLDTQDRELSLQEQRVIAQCLENALIESGLRGRAQLFEATTEDNIAFLGVQLPVIAALLPSLALNELAIVQALDRRVGAVFFMDITYGSDKGSVSAGDTMISPRTGHSRTESQRKYAMTLVAGEAIASSAAASSVVTGTLAYAPGVNVSGGGIVVKDGDGNVIGSDRIQPGVVNGYNVTGNVSATGAYSLTPVTTWDSSGITIDYYYQYDKPTDANGNYKGVPEVDVNLTQEVVEAIDFPLRTRYSVGASIDIQKAHGINLENELVKFLGGEVKFTIDHHGIDLLDDASINGVYVKNVLQTPAPAITAWDAAMNDGQEWVWKKLEWLNNVEEGNINIIAKTLRAQATWMVVGNNVARLVKQLPDTHFKPVANLNKAPMTGPQKIGVLDGRAVIHDPLLPTRDSGGSTITGANRYFMGFKGDSILTGCMAYLPYIPLFTSPTLVTSDMYAQKGFLSAAGFKIINAGMLTHGEVQNM